MRERLPEDPADPTTVIYDLEGKFFFDAAPELDRYFDAVRAHGATILLVGVRPDTLRVLHEQVFPEEEQEFSATLRAVRDRRAGSTRAGTGTRSEG